MSQYANAVQRAKVTESHVSGPKFRTCIFYDFSKIMKQGEIISPPMKAVSIEDQMRAIDPSFFEPMKGFCTPKRSVCLPPMTLKMTLPCVDVIRTWSETVTPAVVRPRSEIHAPVCVMRLLGGGRKNRVRGKAKTRKTGVDIYLDIAMGGRKGLKISDSWFIPRAIDQERCRPWVDLVKVLVDLFYSSFILDETMQDHASELNGIGTKAAVTLHLSVFSKIQDLLQAPDPQAIGLSTIILPLITGGTQPGSLLRWLFRSHGKFLNKYFVSDIHSRAACAEAQSHSRTCTCVMKIRGIGPFYGFGAEFAFNNLQARAAFMYDVESKFFKKGTEILSKGMRHGFAFTVDNIFDLHTTYEESFITGSSVLTSVSYVKHDELPLVVEKTKILFRLALTVGYYAIVAFPSTSVLKIDSRAAFYDAARLPNAIFSYLDVVKDRDHEVKLTQKLGGTCVHDGFWYIAWQVADREISNCSYAYCSFHRVLVGNTMGHTKKTVLFPVDPEAYAIDGSCPDLDKFEGDEFGPNL
jgi:hypothetical protein